MLGNKETGWRLLSIREEISTLRAKQSWQTALIYGLPNTGKFVLGDFFRECTGSSAKLAVLRLGFVGVQSQWPYNYGVQDHEYIPARSFHLSRWNMAL